LTRPLLLNRHQPVFKDTGPKPFLDEPDDALIADPVFQEADDPFLGDFREERPNVGVEYEVHFLAADPNDECIQRIVLAAPRSESVREAQKVLFPYLVEDRSYRGLDDLIFQCRDSQWSLPSIAFRNPGSS
jgi:hypothetical protein